VWVPLAELPRVVTALGAGAVVTACHSLDAFVASVRSGAAAAVLREVCLTGRDVEDLAHLFVRYPTTVVARLATPPGWDPVEIMRLFLIGDMAATPMPPSERAPGWRALFRPADQEPPGWQDWTVLRRSLAAARLTDPAQRACVAAVLADVWYSARTSWDAPGEAPLFKFFAAAFGPDIETVGDVATRLGVDAAALETRFLHAGLPGASRYVAAARLVRAAWMGASPAPDAVEAAVRPTHPEAPVHIRRAVRRLGRLATLTSRAAGGFPGADGGRTVLRSFRTALTAPYRDALRAFDLGREAAP
jgi:hypothetical protein